MSTRATPRSRGTPAANSASWVSGLAMSSAAPSVGIPGARHKLGHEVSRYIRDAILSGAFVPGQRMGVHDIAESLGVSTMPVREALVTLANEGLLDVLPRRGFRVARLRQTDIHDVYQIHAFVSGLLAGYAATVISPRQIAELREIDERIGRLERRRLSSVERSERIEELNFKFHRTINLATDHGRLQWYLRTAGQYIPRRFHTRIVGWDETTVHGHTEIINALERHNARRARRLVETHVSIAGDLIIANLDKLGLWSADGPAPEG